MLQWRDSSGKTDASSPRSAGFARGGLTVRSRKAKPWKAASRLQLIYVSCSAIPRYESINQLSYLHQCNEGFRHKSLAKSHVF
ncbi:hypothetical protein HUG20_16310 [Salicibibacter cibi]|uniref:Uncharacterized protein n=1 Tax=Salicibibacter cibi TaxID=2743001 RepID=A0A7T7CGL5_9BACI|nr:hypothetical protein [Salicibibacter cibi]QQK81317.1 hypothetical protein HUG20_16310 [Salicibibacter cibi]